MFGTFSSLMAFPLYQSKPATISDHWQYRWSTIQAELKNLTIYQKDRVHWIHTENVHRVTDRNSRTVLWLKTVLPDTRWKDPTIYVPTVFLGIQIFINKELIYNSGNLKENGDVDFVGLSGTYISLPENYRNAEIQFMIFSPWTEIGFHRTPLIGERADLILYDLQQNIIPFMVGFVIAVLGILSFIVSIIQGKKRDLLSGPFGLFSFSTGLWLILSSPMLPLFSEHPILIFITQQFLFHLGLTGLIILYERLFNSGPFHLVKHTWHVMVVYLILIFFYPVFILNHIYGAISLMLILSRLLIFAVIILLTSYSIYHAIRGNQNAIIISAAYFMLSLFGLREILIISDDTHMLYHWGILLFVITLGFVIFRYIQQLRSHLQQHTRKLQKAELDLGIAQLKILQDRMNPHFLLNSLSLVHALLEKGKWDQIRKVAVYLSEHYRFLTDHSYDNLISLSEELDFCENYLKIQYLRFHDTLEYEIHRNGNLKDVLVSPLTIQPLVENSIKHGLRSKIGPGKVVIIANHSSGNTVLTVEDNGAGLQTSDPFRRTLGNIRSRLQYFYKDAIMTMENRDVETGVRVTIKISGFRQPSENNISDINDSGIVIPEGIHEI